MKFSLICQHKSNDWYKQDGNLQTVQMQCYIDERNLNDTKATIHQLTCPLFSNFLYVLHVQIVKQACTCLSPWMCVHNTDVFLSSLMLDKPVLLLKNKHLFYK